MAAQESQQEPSKGADNLPVQRAVDMEDLARIARAVSESGLVRDAKTAAAAGVKMVTATHLGFSPMAGLLGVDVIEGKPRLSARMLLAAVRRHPLYEYRPDGAPTAERAGVVILHRQSVASPWEEMPVIEWTAADTKRAKLDTKDVWQRYPTAMGWWRACRMAVDFFAPEVSLEYGLPPEWEETGYDPSTGEVVIEPPEEEPPSAATGGEESPVEEGPVDLPADLAEAQEVGEEALDPGDPGDAEMPPLSNDQHRALMAACGKAGVGLTERKRLMAFFSQGRSQTVKGYPQESFRALMGVLEKGKVPEVVWEAVAKWEERVAAAETDGPE